MQDDEETAPQGDVDNGGKKIKMNRIGRKPKKGAAAADDKTSAKKATGADKG